MRKVTSLKCGVNSERMLMALTRKRVEKNIGGVKRMNALEKESEEKRKRKEK